MRIVRQKKIIKRYDEKNKIKVEKGKETMKRKERRKKMKKRMSSWTRNKSK